MRSHRTCDQSAANGLVTAPARAPVVARGQEEGERQPRHTTQPGVPDGDAMQSIHAVRHAYVVPIGAGQGQPGVRLDLRATEDARWPTRCAGGLPR
jgi:hypothetical protein